MASVAAIVILPLGIISINTGYEVLLIAVAVGIVGGLESVPGILVASLILGYAQIITGTYFKPEWMMVVYLAAIVLVLAIKPSGLFGKFKELEERGLSKNVKIRSIGVFFILVFTSIGICRKITIDTAKFFLVDLGQVLVKLFFMSYLKIPFDDISENTKACY